MTTLSFDASRIMFRHPAADRSALVPARRRHDAGQAPSLRRARMIAGFVGRAVLALVPFSALAGMFIAL